MQSWSEPSCRRAFLQLAAFFKRMKKLKSAQHTKNIQPLTKQFTVCTRCYDPRKTICLYFLSQCVTYNALYLRPLIAFRACTRRPGCFLGAWSSWHKEVVSSHLKSWTFLFVSCAFCYSSLWERSGRRKPPAERSALLYECSITYELKNMGS